MTTSGSAARVGHLGARKLVREERLSLRLKRNSRLPRYIQQIIHQRFQQWDSFFASDRFPSRSGHRGLKGRWCRPPSLVLRKNVNPLVDLFSARIFRVHGDKELSAAAWVP